MHEVDDLVSDDVIISRATTEYFMEENPSAPPHGRCDVEIPPLCVAAPCGGPERDRDSKLPLAHVVAVINLYEGEQFSLKLCQCSLWGLRPRTVRVHK